MGAHQRRARFQERKTMNTLTKTEERPSASTRKPMYLTPAANIFENKDGYLLQAEMPGVSKDGLEITIENNELVITGRRSADELNAELVYRESRPLDYRRVFDLDPSIDLEKITAKIEQGVLTLTLPKAERVKPRKITVE
jgi:HSP20 family protein